MGFTVVNGTIAIARKAMKTAMTKVKALTPRGTNKDMETTLKTINQWYVGWANYFSLSSYPAQLQAIEAHIRRRLRSRLVDQQKRKRNLYRMLVKRGVSKAVAAKTVYSHRKRWALSKTWAMSKAYPNGWFIRQGQVIRSNQKQAHWFEVSQWVNLA